MKEKVWKKKEDFVSPKFANVSIHGPCSEGIVDTERDTSKEYT